MSRPRVKAALLLLAVLALASTASGVTVAAYVARTTNDSTFTASASFPTFRMATGSYTGDGASASIPIGFQPDLVIVKGNSAAQPAVVATSEMPGMAKPLVGLGGARSGAITALSASGFSIGTDGAVNVLGTTYRWVALKTASGRVALGSYTGSGAAGRSITGIGFQPRYVAVMSPFGRAAVQRFAGAARTYPFDDAAAGSTGGITGFGADGFTVGADPEVNDNTIPYTYLAVADMAGAIKVGSYTGNGADNRGVTGVGFAPDFVTVRADDPVTMRPGSMRSAAQGGDATMRFGAFADVANRLQALQADGFQVGTDGSVNAGGVSYPYVAMKNTGGGCAVHSRQTASVSADAWVDQSSPGSNTGSDSVLKVTSKGPSVNTRAFLRFTLPAAPAGCSVTGATLRVYNKSPASGRTLQVQGSAAGWTENGLTWANQPAATGTAATAAVPGSAGYMSWEVGSLVQAMYSGSNNGFQIRDQTENGPGAEQQLDSRESGGNPAQLVIHFG